MGVSRVLCVREGGVVWYRSEANPQVTILIHYLKKREIWEKLRENKVK